MRTMSGFLFPRSDEEKRKQREGETDKKLYSLSTMTVIRRSHYVARALLRVYGE